MVRRVATLAAWLAAAPAFAQVAAPVTSPPPKPTFAQIGRFIYPAKDQSADQQKKTRMRATSGPKRTPA